MNQKRPSEKIINFAIIGGGAMTEQQHLPLLCNRDDCKVLALVEVNKERAKRLAEQFAIPHFMSDYRDLKGLSIDGVIIVLPNHLHAPVSIDLLESGMHVLVEKPMACNVQQCNEMIRASEKNKRVLAVGLMRRYSQASRAAKKSIENGLLGQIVSFDIRNGFSASKWPFASDFILRKESAGGGVLMDLGVHTIDQLLWWLGDYESFHYFDDNYGGIEADCLIKINLKSGAKGDIEISRTRDLRETAIIRGERAILEVALVKNFMSLKFIDNGFSIKGSTEINGEIAIIEQRAAHLIKAEHDDFIAAIRNGQSSSICGREGKRSIELIEACYRERRLLVLPWMNFHAERHKETVQ